MLDLNHYERLAAEGIRAAAEGAAVARFDDELVLRPSRAAIEAMTEDDIVEERAMFAATTTGRDLLRRQGWSDAEIAALAAKQKPTKAPSPAPQPAVAKAPAVAAAPPIARTVHTPPIAAPTVSPPVLAGTPDGWRAEFAACAELQAEFGSVDRWVNYQQGVADGRIRHHGGVHRAAL